MKIEWFSRSTNGLATIYDTNITLNTVASNHFKGAYGTMIGYDAGSKALIIKAISKQELSLGLFRSEEIHPISIKPSYGRINGKGIVRDLCTYFPLKFDTVPSHKFECEWFQEDNTLKIFLNKEVK